MALALKSKTLLYAASPLFNTDKPYLSYGDERDSLICYRKKDPTLWDKAATAGRQVLDWAKLSISIALIHIIRHISTKSGGIWYVSVVQFITHGGIPHMPCL